MVRERYGDVRDRYLPRSDKLIPADEPANRTVTDGDEKGLVRDRRKPQYPINRLAQVDAIQIERPGLHIHGAHVAQHPRRLAEEHVDWHVDGIVLEQRVLDDQLSGSVDFADHGVRASLAYCDVLEDTQRRGLHAEHVSLLRLVAPQLHRRHSRLGAGNRAQVNARAPLAVRYSLGHRIRQSARAHIVNEHDGILIAELPASVDDFLRAALDFRIAPLNRGEIQVRARGSAADGGCRAAAETDQHRRTAEHDEPRTHRHFGLLNVRTADIAQSAGDHDGFVIAAHTLRRISRRVLLERAEVTEDGRTAELVVERGRPDGRVDHDLKGRGDPFRPAKIALPRALEAGYTQIRDRETGKTRLRLRSTSRRTLVADLPARACRCSRKR